MAVLDKIQTKKTYSRELAPQRYVDPNIQYYDTEKIPEGRSYPALSSVPKEYLNDPNADLPTDRSPVDWPITSEIGPDISTEERNQRALVRDYVAQKYGEAASTKGVEAAMEKQKYDNQWANAGHNVDRMLMAHSAARGGPGADAAYWQGQKRESADNVAGQEGLRQAKIKDYLMQKNLGSQGVEELQKVRGYDITNAQNDPQSDISMTYQNAFGAMFPKEAEDMGGDIKNMSATEIQGITKMYGAKADSDFKRSVERAKLGYADTGNQLRERQIGNEEAKTAVLAPKTQAEIDKIKADTALSNARTKAVQTGKPAAGIEGKPTKAYESVDRDYAKQYNDWTTSGRPTYVKNSQILEDAKKSLMELTESEKGSVSGRGTSALGSISGGLLRTDKSLRIENDVKQAAQSSLKAILGAAYTAAEGESVMNKSYDIRLPPSENIKKIDRAIKELEGRASAEEDRANWFEKYGTTYGFKSKSADNLIKMQSPDGEIRLVPNSSVDKYLQKGGKVVQ